jgi:hypothetical protein
VPARRELREERGSVARCLGEDLHHVRSHRARDLEAAAALDQGLEPRDAEARSAERVQPAAIGGRDQMNRAANGPGADELGIVDVGRL